MIETICRNCGARYQVGTDHMCVATKSTAARKDVRSVKAPRQRQEGPQTVAEPRVQAAGEIAAGSGNQAPPVDTKSRNANRHRPSYFTDYMRKRRAAMKDKAI